MKPNGIDPSKLAEMQRAMMAQAQQAQQIVATARGLVGQMVAEHWRSILDHASKAPEPDDDEGKAALSVQADPVGAFAVAVGHIVGNPATNFLIGEWNLSRHGVRRSYRANTQGTWGVHLESIEPDEDAPELADGEERATHLITLKIPVTFTETKYRPNRGAADLIIPGR